jgi:hypothetical protein
MVFGIVSGGLCMWICLILTSYIATAEHY